MTKTNNKKLNTELITSLSNEDYRKLVDKDCQNQFQMGGYMCTIISNEKGYRNWDGMYWVDSDGKLWPYIGRLYHANSVPTAFDYISRGYIYSRQKGDEFNKQTAQRSDELDKALGIYNDIFFDTSDIPYCVGTNTSAYGPIMFVLKPQLIKGKRIRVTKLNPFVKNNLTYDSLYYKDVEGIKAGINDGGTTRFLMNTMHHTTIYNTDTIPLKGNLEAIYIERHRSGDRRELKLRDRLRRELDKNGLEDVEIAIREMAPKVDNFGYANDYNVLWNEPVV